MAKPRVFVSSTYYDLRQVREDIERLINELGYEPVLNEKGDIAYGKEDRLEEYAYREIDICDILISIIGGRYGTESQHDSDFSISQNELKRALERGVQVFIFIERNVNAEYSTYQLNKGKENVRYRFVDNLRVYEFIEQLQKLPRNNSIATFETAADITAYLKDQWSGLFQRFLQEQRRRVEFDTLQEMNSVSATLRELVTYLTEERKNKDDAIQSILLANHPVFRKFADLTKTHYRVFFSNQKEFTAWMGARGWRIIKEDKWDEDSVQEWANNDREKFNGYLKITNNLFHEDGRLKVFTESEWNDNWVNFVERQASPSSVDDSPPLPPDDDVPF